MAYGQHFYPSRVNIDLAEGLCDPTIARYIQNLVWEVTDTSGTQATQGAQTGVGKPIESNYLIGNMILPTGTNFVVGSYSSKETATVLVAVWNSAGNHTLYQIDGTDETIQIVDQGPCLELSNNPQFFIGEGQCYLQLVYLTDPDTDATILRTFFYYTTGQNTQKRIVIEDSIATSGYSATLFPYFISSYNPCWMRRMGLSTPTSCVTVAEVPITPADLGLSNQIIYNPLQFRIKYNDVWGEPSEYSSISDLYIPGINDCLSGSTGIARCLNLAFDAGSPIVDTIEVAFRYGNSTQWYTDTVLYMYDGSNIGDWWQRPRNTDGTFQYNESNNQVTYTFCRNKELNPIAPAATNRLENPLPNTSQAIFKLGKYLALANNTDGFLPFSQNLKEQFTINVTPPGKNGNQLRNITIYVPIWNQGTKGYEQVTKFPAGFVWGDNGNHHGGAKNYLQYFGNPLQSGFLGYLAGSSNFAISTQVYQNAAGVLTDDPNFDGLSVSFSKLSFQKFVFTNVQPGTYIFRLASHLADPTLTTTWATTSTTVWGLCPFNPAQLTAGFPFTGGFNPLPQQSISIAARMPYQELEINVCTEDYSTLTDNRILVIADCAYDLVQAFPAPTLAAISTSGYFYETENNGAAQYPMELMTVSQQGGFSSLITDHNGFYYTSTVAKGRDYAFTFDYLCQKRSIYSDTSWSPDRGMNQHNVIIDQYLPVGGGIPVFSNFNSEPCNRILVTGQVLLEPDGIPVPNVTVVLSRGATGTTDDAGNFTIVAHDDIGAPVRKDNIVIASTGCNYTGLNGACLVPINVVIQPCIPNGQCITRTVIVPTISVYFAVLRGLLTGGTYAIGATRKDWLGRIGFVQPLGYITIPSFFQTGVIAPSTVSISIGPGAVFPSGMVGLSFWITEEITYSNYITWIVDRTQLIDNTGNINPINPSQIKIFYSSIIEYNKQNNYNTTDNWAFIPAQQSTPAIGDQVSFFINGDGTPYTANISLVKYDQTGQYFLIDYTAQLANLTANALMRLMRPAISTAQQPEYFELCGDIAISGGVPSKYSIVLNAYDTYYLSRQIPVPTPLNSSTAGLSVTTTTSSISAGVTTTDSYTVLNPATTNELRTFGFLFEHGSPSNFWGLNDINIGRVNTSDPYETQVYTPNGIAISGALSATDQLNYLCYFDDALKVSYDNSNLNGIVAGITQMSVLLLIGQSNHFKTGFSDNLLRGNQDGTATIGSINDTLGQPETKVGQTFGCFLIDKSTISEFNGIVMWIDRAKTAVVRYDYTLAMPISYNVCDSYIVPKVKAIMQANLMGSNWYFVGKINKNNSEYLLTDFNQSAPTYVNQSREYSTTVPNTIAFDSRNGVFKGWYSQTPEYYSGLEGELNDQQLFTFKGGNPYGNYNVNAPTYGVIFGQTVSSVYRFIFSLGKDKKGKLLSVAVYCKETPWFIDQLLTETGQSSRVLLAYFNQAMYFWQAPTLCDLNTPFDPNLPIATGPNVLTDGNNLVGTWFDFRFVVAPSGATSYFELGEIDAFVFGAEKSGT